MSARRNNLKATAYPEMRDYQTNHSISSKRELSYSAFPCESVQLSCSPILPSEQGEAIDEVLRAYGIEIPPKAFQALVDASKRSVAGLAFSMARAIIASLKDKDSPDITPLKCLLLERLLGLNYLTFDDIAKKCSTSKQNAHIQFTRMIARMSTFANDPQDGFDLPLFVAALSQIAPKN